MMGIVAAARRRLHLRCVSVLVLVVAPTMLAACSDPAPGEGMEHSLADGPMPKVVPASEAVRSSNIAKIDPETLNQPEIQKVIPAGPYCHFSYTAESPPVFAASVVPQDGAVGVIKIHGRLVEITSAETKDFQALANGGNFNAETLSFEVMPAAQYKEDDRSRRSASAHLEIADELTVGYQGWYRCEAPLQAK